MVCCGSAPVVILDLPSLSSIRSKIINGGAAIRRGSWTQRADEPALSALTASGSAHCHVVRGRQRGPNGGRRRMAARGGALANTSPPAHRWDGSERPGCSGVDNCHVAARDATVSRAVRDATASRRGPTRTLGWRQLAGILTGRSARRYGLKGFSPRRGRRGPDAPASRKGRPAQTGRPVAEQEVR